MTEGLFKWIYTFVLLIVTIFWATFTFNAIAAAATSNETPADEVKEALQISGSSMLMGALIVWNGNVNQHWFRKRGPDEINQDTIQLNRVKKKDIDGN